MPILIYSAKPNDPTITEVQTQTALAEIYPDEKIAFSNTLNTVELSGKFTLVIGGGNLYQMLHGMKDHNIRDNCLNAMEEPNSCFIGICAGAYYGAERYIASKDPDYPYFAFDESSCDTAVKAYGEALGMIENTTAVGPFKPYAHAYGDPTHMRTHAVGLSGNRKFLETLYVEGPMFFNKDFSKVYEDHKKRRATYVVGYDPVIKKYYETPRAGFDTTLQLQDWDLPAILHDTTKNHSQRYLIGPHLELATAARTYVPALENVYARSVKPMSQEDKGRIMTAESEEKNKQFLKNLLTNK